MSSNLNMLVYMIHFYRFTTLIGAVLICSALCWLGLRTYGLSRSVIIHQTKLVEQLSETKDIQWKKYDPEDKSSQYFYLDVFYSNENWRAGSKYKNWPLADFLASQPQTFFIFNIKLTENKHTAQLKSLIDEGKSWERIIFTAPVEDTLTTLRELSPRWTFTSGPMFSIRFTTLATLKLESLMDIKADVLYISTNSQSSMHNLNVLIDEALRQKKYILIGPVPKPWDEKANIGWMIDTTE